MAAATTEAVSPEKVPPELRAFYDYMNDSSKCEGSQLVKDIDDRVRKYNTNDWRVKRMRFEELRREQYEKGLAEGAAEMQERLNKLALILDQQNRSSEYFKAASDPAFQQQLLEEFGLTAKK